MVYYGAYCVFGLEFPNSTSNCFKVFPNKIKVVQQQQEECEIRFFGNYTII